MRLSLKTLAIVAVTALAAGCSVIPSQRPGPQTGRSSPSPAPRPVQQCNQAGAQWAVGKANTEHNINEARKRSGAYMARVLRPGQVTTREFNAERLNLEVDATGRIIAARCG